MPPMGLPMRPGELNTYRSAVGSRSGRASRMCWTPTVTPLAAICLLNFGHHRPVAEPGGVEVLDLHRAFPSWVTGTRARAAAGSRSCIKETPTP